MRFEIRPNVSAGTLMFGMERAQVTKILGPSFQAFRRTKEDNEGEYYPDIGVFTCYDNNKRLEALEFAKPAEPVLDGLNLLSLNLSQARDLFRAAGGPMHDYSDGPISKVLGIGVWAPACKESAQAPLESVIAFGPGYYEQYPDGD